MARQRLERDLFGKVIPKKKSRLQTELEKFDRDTMQGRMDRLKFVKAFIPRNVWLSMSIETATIFSEVKMAFVNGEYVSTILLAVCFAEHWLGGYLEGRKYSKKAYSSLSTIIDTLREDALVPEYLLSRLDRLREIRNPFVHMKNWDHPAKLDRRWILERKPPFELLEEDAREALSLMYQLVTEPSQISH